VVKVLFGIKTLYDSLSTIKTVTLRTVSGKIFKKFAIIATVRPVPIAVVIKCKQTGRGVCLMMRISGVIVVVDG
jgi:hypothetical protein